MNASTTRVSMIMAIVIMIFIIIMAFGIDSKNHYMTVIGISGIILSLGVPAYILWRGHINQNIE
jgi:hypothetical protein